MGHNQERGSARSPIEGQKPERGCSQGRGARHKRSAAQRALILDGRPSGGYNGQNQLQRGALLYCVDILAYNSSMAALSEAQPLGSILEPTTRPSGAVKLLLRRTGLLARVVRRTGFRRAIQIVKLT